VSAVATNQSKSERSFKIVSLPRICKFKKGDRLQLMVGKKAGPQAIGNLVSIDSKKRRVLIEGVNKVVKHVRADPSNPGKPSGRVEVEASVHVSNVALVCPKCFQPTRVGWKILEARKENGKVNKVRICRKCKQVIDEGA
jgi:large subunit ribosomal protein L24